MTNQSLSLISKLLPFTLPAEHSFIMYSLSASPSLSLLSLPHSPFVACSPSLSSILSWQIFPFSLPFTFCLYEALLLFLSFLYNVLPSIYPHVSFVLYFSVFFPLLFCHSVFFLSEQLHRCQMYQDKMKQHFTEEGIVVNSVVTSSEL